MKAVPPGWKTARISDLTVKAQKLDPVETGRDQIWYVDIGSLDGPTAVLSEVPLIHAATAPSRCRQVIAAGDTLYSTVRPYLRKIGYVGSALNGEFASTGYCVLRPKDEIDSKYLFYFVQSQQFEDQILPLQKGVSYPAVLDREVKAQFIPYPPVSVQRRIVEVLEEHLSHLDAAEDHLGLASTRVSRLWSSIITRRLLPDGAWDVLRDDPSTLGDSDPPRRSLPIGWSWQRWAEVGISQNGKAFPSRDYCDDGTRLLRPGNLHASGAIRWPEQNTRRLPPSYRVTHATNMLRAGDLVMNLTAQSLADDFLGRVCMVTTSDESLLNQRLARLTSNALPAEYTLAVFRSGVFRHYVKSLNTGSLIQHMFTKQVDRFWLPVAPPSEQESVVAESREAQSLVDRSLETLVVQQSRVVALRRAVLAAAFEGKLTGRHTDNEVIEEEASGG